MNNPLSPDIFARFEKYGRNGCPRDIAVNLAVEEIIIAERAFIKSGPKAVDYKRRSPHIDDYMTAYKAGLRARV